jgi:regulator of sigma D
MVYVIIGLTILVGILGYLTYINFKRAEKAEEYCEAYVRFISALYFRFYETRDRMKDIDRLGAFQADDEVGVIFREMDESIDNLYDFITKYVNNTEAEKDEKAQN